MKRSLFNQMNQVRGTIDFEDLSNYMNLAETTGRPYLTGTITVTAGSATVTDSSNVFGREEQNNFIVIADGAAAGTYAITAGSGANTATVSPVPTADATVAYGRFYYQNLEDDLNYLRSAVKRILGETTWTEKPDTDLRNMAYLIPKTPNLVGDNTQYPGVRSGDVTFTIDDIDQTGYVSTGAPAGEYTDNTTSVTAGTSLYFTDDNTMVIAIPGGFYPADLGVLNITKDGAVVGTLDLAAAWTADACSYEETESDVGTNPAHTATGVGTNVINLSARRCMNTSVDGYSNFWPPYQIASMSATLTLPAGFQGQIAVTHSMGGSENYTYSTFYVDTTSQTITAVAPTVAEGTPVLRYLSGVPFYNAGSTFNASINSTSTIFDRGYVANPLTYNLTNFNAANITPTLTALGLTAPLAITDTLGNQSTVVTVGATNYRNLDARATATYRDVFGLATSANSAAGTFRIDTYGTTSTDTVENFDDEAKRFVGTEDFNNVSLAYANSTWNSATNVTTLGEKGLEVYNGTLVYPTINHTTFLPAGPNYSSQTGDFVYYRLFVASGAFTNGTLTFGGWSNALSTIQGSGVDVSLRYLNCTNYGNGNTGSAWQDLSVDQTTFGANGCLGAGSTGSVVAFSFGTTSSVTFGNKLLVKVVFKNSSVTALTGITFNPTL